MKKLATNSKRSRRVKVIGEPRGRSSDWMLLSTARTSAKLIQ
jgi:hypothetical protein